MKRYITTERFEFGRGHIIQEEHGKEWEYVLKPKNSPYQYPVWEIHLEELIQQRKAKELQEPKWTDQDMIDFARFYFYEVGPGGLKGEDILKNWQNQRS